MKRHVSLRLGRARGLRASLIFALGMGLASVGAATSAPAAPHGAASEDGHGAHHIPHFSDINWYHGLLGEREGEPSLWFRPPGTPVPLAALLVNTAILFWLLVRFGRPAIRAGLTARKERVESGIVAAAAMKREAEEQLAHYESKLARIDQEIERVKSEMRDQAEGERKRVLEEASVRREQMDRDVHLLLAQELKAARQELFHEVVENAMRAAEETIFAQLSNADQQRLAEEFLAGIESSVQRSAGRRVEVES